MQVDYELRRRIERAFKKGNAHCDLDAFLYNLETDHAFILNIDNTLVGYEVRVELGTRYLLVMFMEGSDVLKQIDLFIQMTSELARRLDCIYVETFGRLGWSRVFRSKGIKTHYVAYKMEVL